jgi:hypothetical protein
VTAGKRFTLTVRATGTGPLNYQWRLNGQPIPGASQKSYVISAVTPAHAGQYDVVVSNGADSKLSPATTLVVNIPAYIISPPTNTVVTAGSSSALHVQAGGTPPLTYQWFLGNTKVRGATNQDITISQDTAGQYRVLVKNKFGIAYSEFAEVTVFAGALAARIQPVSNAPVLRVQRDLNGLLEIEISGASGSYAVEGSTDLQKWTVIGVVGVADHAGWISLQPKGLFLFLRARHFSEE